MQLRAAIAPVLGLLLLACDAGNEPSAVASIAGASPPGSTASATRPPSPAASASMTPIPTDAPAINCASEDAPGPLVAYVDAGDLWLYDGTADAARRLSNDGESRIEHAPAFLAGSCVVYASSEPSAIEVVDLVGSASRTIVEESGWITALAISPDDASIVYLQIDHFVDSTYRLKRVEVDRGTPEILHTFHANPGRGAGSEDEVSVAWSPDGSGILVANTHEFTRQDPYGAIYLFDRGGREVRATWTGTHPRWSSDGRTVYYRGHAGVNGQGWSAMDVNTMHSSKLAIRPGTNNLVVSPDGEWVAYDNSWFGDLPNEADKASGAPETYAYNLASGEERLLQRGALGPLWLSGREVIVTNASERGRRSLNSWESLGTVTRVSVGGVRTELNMTSTLFEVAVHLGT